MKKLLDLMHLLWITIQMASPPIIQDRILPFLFKVRDNARLWLKPYLTVYRWQGQNKGGSLTVSYAGLGYIAEFVKHLLFVEKPAVSEIARIPIWGFNALTNLPDSDLTIIEANKTLVQRLARQKRGLVLPFQVRLMLDVHGSWQDVRGRMHRTVRGGDLRLVRKYCYEYTVSKDDQDLELFYHTTYLPTLTARYTELASPMPLAEARRFFRHGMLIVVERDGQQVAGVLCSIHRDVVIAHLIGVRNADRQLMKEGAQAAVFYAMAQWANKEGYRYVDLGGCWPYIEGVFYYKRKWGAVAQVLQKHQSKRIWFKIQRNTPAVARFLQDYPCVVLDEADGLHVLVTPDDGVQITDKVRSRWDKQYMMPGMEGILARTVNELAE